MFAGFLQRKKRSIVGWRVEGELLVLVKIEDLLMYGAEHAGLATPWLYPQDRAELAVELCGADREGRCTPCGKGSG